MPEFLAFPTVLEQDHFRTEEHPSLRSKMRRRPGKRARQLVELAIHAPELFALVARIHRAGFGYAARSEPVLLFKFLGQYLSNSFDTAARLRSMSHHYETLAVHFPDLGRSAFRRDGMLLWSHRAGLDTFTIRLCMPGASYLEGDLSLVFSVNGNPLHKLSFTCIRGEEAGLEVETALLIGGSQGFPGTLALIRQAR